ncbi:crotonase/enoyl-CoA hydratase family protein [Leptospira langatensis]|uniref:Crotonase/enoyl-CoA hydratase family protein n=1 Tax=Leptospira langatensis TaxID=2484983 RepID=A0A5F1ZS16_9LEPT|nr:crotonase/enoyl-CoA hydratase family protein [Leptospira langatensis]TGJ99027.1 crotonase/enoyl-CoA hydratase family protein [Leptospira langatensis]TGL40404.1 crotonase/enoyl-CoA hydratase family protein [Leptospira langatensis]
MTSYAYILTEKKGPVFSIILNRPSERNAMNTQMIFELCDALTKYEDDTEARCAVIHANGLHFTFGLELQEVANTLLERGENLFPPKSINPWDTGGTGRIRKKPVICAVHGFCLTLGIELLLACDIGLAAEKTVFAQMEVQRGIPPFGGATVRFVRTAGWGNAMKYILTGDSFDAKEAYRMGIVQEVLPKKDLLPRAFELAEKISAQAPLAVQASIANARKALEEGQAPAISELFSITIENLRSPDGQEGVRSFLEKRNAVFKGK